ncbi:MAG TPA: Clp protease N-terminal domain-containing protein [Hyphomicrobiaceae bacterium]|nr:Clp protease N-terminal domain-containing protein [Hyphomicrobiaceae bacterium]
MAYRGDDLDLRTPRSGREGSMSSEYASGNARGRSSVTGGLVVDDTVLACCNHAFDIALAHGATEVRLEHLVHALTRVPEAANILEDRGIREAHLRRESAAVIASEIPVGLAHTSGAPRASYEFEDVLRRASGMAGDRGSIATVHDLLWVLLSYDHDNPAITLLRRHAVNWQSWEWPNRRETRGEVVREIVREVRVPEAPRREEPRREAVRYTDRRDEPPRRREPYRTERVQPQVIERVVQAPAPRNDEVLYRIDALEGSLRSLMDLVRDISLDVRDGRGGGSVSVDVAPDAFIDHVRNVESTFDDRLAALERQIASISSENARNWSQFGDRLKAIDKIAAGTSNTSGLADLVTEQLVAVGEQVRSTAERIQRLESLAEQRHAEQSRNWQGLGERLRAFEESNSQQKRDMQASLVAASTAGTSLHAFVSERFQAVKSQLDQARNDVPMVITQSVLPTIAQAVEPVAAKVRDIEISAERRQQEINQQLASHLRALADRLVAIDGAVKAQSEGVANVAAAHQRDLAEVHEALLKLGTNQQTLSNNLEQWRLESGGDLGIISNRLELMERSSARPIELIEQMQGDLANVTQLALADYDQNRRSFKTWLFGTNDVFAGSWRDETAAVRARLKEMRGGRQKA